MGFVEELEAMLDRAGLRADFRRLLGRVRRAGADPEAWARDALQALRRILDRPGRPAADPRAVLYDVARAHTDRPPPPAEALGLEAGYGLIATALGAALIISRRRHVVVKLRTADDVRLEMQRLSAVGFGPRAAALFEYALSLARLLPDEAFRPVPDRDLFLFEVPIRRVKELLGLRGKLHTRAFRHIASVLTAQFAGYAFAPDGFRGEAVSVFERVERTRGRRAALRVGIRGWLLRRLREEDGWLRAFDPDALRVLARVDALTAALARFLAVRLHGDAYTRKPLRVPGRVLYALLVSGWTRRPPPAATLRRFLSSVRRSVGRINRLGLLGLLRVTEPSYVAFAVEAGDAVFRRVGALPEGHGALADPPAAPDPTVLRWLEARCRRIPAASEAAARLYADYVDFCRSRGAAPLSRTAWGRQMGRMFRRGLRRQAGRPVRVWQGVGLRPEEEGHGA